MIAAILFMIFLPSFLLAEELEFVRWIGPDMIVVAALLPGQIHQAIIPALGEAAVM